MLYNKFMKKKFSYFVLSASFMFSVVGAPIVVRAEQLGRIEPSRSELAVAETSTTESTTRTTRVEEYKKTLKEALTTAVKTRIIERCVAAQAIVKTKITNNSAITTARAAAYNQIVKDLQAIVTKAASATNPVDTTTLQANITVLQTKITTFTTANTTYQQALTDLSVLDCKTDPTAFKAALEVARTDQLAVLTSAKDIRTYLTGTVKDTLKELKTKLDSAN